MRADGDSIAVKIEFPNDELSEVFDHFQCEQYSSNRYNAGLIQMCAKSLARIPKMDTTMIQVNAEGMLKLQHIISGKDGSTNFISYLIVPDESLEEEKEHEELPEPSYGFQLTD
uniref:Proliferating cell nuclear antigen n=1 Tax=Amorphochlora amoebiformis TaxID=1561963 RepID=A0A7S0DJ79_9EUKA